MSSTRPCPNEIAVKIGAQLRVMYDSVLHEPIPSRFSELLERLNGGKVIPLQVVQSLKESAASPGVAGHSKSASEHDYKERVRRRARVG